MKAPALVVDRTEVARPSLALDLPAPPDVLPDDLVLDPPPSGPIVGAQPVATGPLPGRPVDPKAGVEPRPPLSDDPDRSGAGTETGLEPVSVDPRWMPRPAQPDIATRCDSKIVPNAKRLIVFPPRVSTAYAPSESKHHAVG